MDTGRLITGRVPPQRASVILMGGRTGGMPHVRGDGRNSRVPVPMALGRRGVRLECPNPNNKPASARVFLEEGRAETI